MYMFMYMSMCVYLSLYTCVYVYIYIYIYMHIPTFESWGPVGWEGPGLGEEILRQRGDSHRGIRYGACCPSCCMVSISHTLQRAWQV